MNKIDQPFIGFSAIALLRPEVPRDDDDHAIRGHPPPGERTQPCACRLIEIRRARRVEAELHRGGDLVDVLAAGAAGANKDLFDLVLVDRETVGDRYH